MNEKIHPALGIDYGVSRIGIAATDDFGLMAHPVETVDATRKPLERIAEIVRQRKIKIIIVGLPLRSNGEESESTKRVREFTKNLSLQIPNLPIEFYDEAYTTVIASEKLREAGKNAKRQKAIIDKAAAVEILNGWMNS